MGVETWVAIGKFLGAVFGLTSAGTGAYFWAVTAARLAIVAIAAKAFAPKLDLSITAQEKLITLRDPIAPQTFVYGEDMLSGPMFLANTQGTDNDELWMGVILAGHEIDSFISYRLDDTNIDLSDLSGAFDGDVTGGKYANVASVYSELGTATQAARSEIDSAFGALWTSAHTGQNWSYMMWKFVLVEDNTAFETGSVQNMRAVIRGYKLYDPRLDTTNGGSGPHRLADPTTWEWSDNPALALAHFIIDLKFGMKEDDARVDWPLVIAAADICEDTVTIPSGSQNRYSCNATFRSDEQRGEVRDTLLTCMLGRMVFSQGLWKMWAGAALTADVELTESNLGGTIQVQASAGAKERYNRVRGKFIDPSRNYQAQSYPDQRSTVFETEDGGEVRPLVADFTGTNNSFEAQRNAIITLKQSRNQRIVSFQGNFSVFRIQPGAVCTLSIAEYGFSGEKFFVTEWAMGEKGILLTMIEEDDAAWNDPASPADYTTRTKTGDLIFKELIVPPPTSPTITALSQGIFIEWTNPPSGTWQYIEIHRSTTNVRSAAVLIGTSSANSFTDTHLEQATRYYYWLRAVDRNSRVSPFEPDTSTTTLTVLALTDKGGNLFLDPDFDLSDSIIVKDDQLAPFVDSDYETAWHGIAEDTDLPSTTRDATIELTTNGVAGSNAVLMKNGDPSLSLKRSALRLYAMRRIRQNNGRFSITFRYRTNSATVGFGNDGTNDQFLLMAFSGHDEATGAAGNGLSRTPISITNFFPPSLTFTDITFEFTDLIDPQDSRFWEFALQYATANNQVSPLQEIEFDSIFCYNLDQEYIGATSTVDGKTGLVPPAQAAQQNLYLQGDGTWTAPAGGGGSIGGSILDNQVAVGAATADDIEGSANLVWDGTLLDIAGDIGIRDNDEIQFGDAVGGDGRIYHNDVHLFIEAIKGSLLLRVNGNESGINIVPGAQVSLFHNNSFKLGTTAEGVQVSGSLYINQVASPPTDIANQGQFWVRNDASMTPMFRDTAGLDSELNAGGDVSLTGTPLNNQLAVWTDANTIEGDPLLTFSGLRLIVNGTLDLAEKLTPPGANTGRGQFWVRDDAPGQSPIFTDDLGADSVLNATGGDMLLDTVQNITASKNYNTNVQARFGTGNLSRIFLGGSSDFIIRLNAGIDFQVEGGSSGTELMIRGVPDLGVSLYWNGLLKFSTTTDGIRVNDSIYLAEQVAANSAISTEGQFWVRDDAPGQTPMWTGDDDVDFALNVSGAIADGTVTDAMLRWSGSAWVEETQTRSNSVGHFEAVSPDGTDQLDFYCNNALAIIEAIGPAGGLSIRGSLGEKGLEILGDGTLEIYHNNVRKFFTDTDGINIVGDIALRDNDEIQFGNLAGGDAVIDFSGSNFILAMESSVTAFIISGNAKNIFHAFIDGGVTVYHNGTGKFFSISDGLRVDDSIYVDEQVAANANITNHGQFWVRNDVAQTPMFTDDAGLDSELNASGSGGSPFTTPLVIEGDALASTPPDKNDDVVGTLDFRDSDSGELLASIGTDNGNFELDMFSRGGSINLNGIRDDGTIIAQIVCNGANGQIGLHHDGTGGPSINTQSIFSADGNTSAAQIRNAGNFPRDIGYNVMEWNTKNANMITTDEDWLNHAGEITYSDDATARTYTTPGSSDAVVPIGYAMHVANLGAGNITIVAGSGVTLRTLNGSSTTGSVIVTQWHIVTLSKRSSTLWYAWGGGL